MGEGKTCCCGCCSVRTGTLIITTLWLFLSLFNVLSYSSHLTKLSDDRFGPDELLGDYSFVQRRGYEGAEGQGHESDSGTRELKNIIRWVYTEHRYVAIALTSIYLIVEILNAAVSAFALRVTIKGGPSSRLFPWIVFNSVCLSVSILVAILVTFYLTTQLGGAYGVLLSIVYVCVYYVFFYLIHVVNDHRQELKQAEEGVSGRARAGGGPMAMAVAFDGVSVGFVGGGGGGGGGGGSQMGMGMGMQPPQMQYPVQYGHGHPPHGPTQYGYAGPGAGPGGQYQYPGKAYEYGPGGGAQAQPPPYPPQYHE